MFEISSEAKEEMFKVFLEKCGQFGYGITQVGIALELMHELSKINDASNFEKIKEGLQVSHELLVETISEFTVHYHNIQISLGFFNHQDLLDRMGELDLEEEERQELINFLEQLGRPTEE